MQLDLEENEEITLTTEDGETVRLEYMTCVDYHGETYGAFYPVLENDEDILDADYDMLILRVYELDGQTAFDLVDEDDEETLSALEDIFMEKIFGPED